MDIGSGSGYPSANLSNFTPHPFVIDDIQCNSMEGFLQSLKFSNPEMQIHVCTLVGKAAKFKGKKKKWFKTQTLFWKGVEIDRHGEEYQKLIERAFDCMFENSKFRQALKATNGCTLTHSIGKNKESDTVLTEREFISNLYRLRNKIND